MGSLTFILQSTNWLISVKGPMHMGFYHMGIRPHGKIFGKPTKPQAFTGQKTGLSRDRKTQISVYKSTFPPMNQII